MRTTARCLPLVLLLVLAGANLSVLSAAEIVALSPNTWDEYVPQGKEVDCIYGDFVLRNHRVVAVVARPVAGRNANLTVRNVRGALLDLTLRDRQNDQLSAFYPGAALYDYAQPMVAAGDKALQPAGNDTKVSGAVVTLQCTAPGQQTQAGRKPQVIVRYRLEDDRPYLLIETEYFNPYDEAMEVPLGDSIRADRTFERGLDGEAGFVWYYDPWFHQAYGVLAEGHQAANPAVTRIGYSGSKGPAVKLAKGERYTLRRRIFPAATLLELYSLWHELRGTETVPVDLRVEDPAGPVAEALVTLRQGEQRYAFGRTPDNGQIAFRVPPGKYELTVSAVGRPEAKETLDTAQAGRKVVALELPGYVVAEISDEQGGPIPCKVQFVGRGDTNSPDFGPDSKAWQVGNCYYSHTGRFAVDLDPGSYDVIISRGPEYDAVFTQLDVARGKEAMLRAKLVRTVKTPGWISADYHSHSSPSGDNTSEQLGRVLNLLAEHVEFAPCTEHNRISSYVPHLKALEVEALMATCSGMELTGTPGSYAHQNAFPLVPKWRTQDNGAPQTDLDPVVQIARLAMWDDGSDKLVQQNHPNLVQILSDRDNDGKYDGGFEKMFQYMDVIEVHPPHTILSLPEKDPAGRQTTNRIVNWLQLLNLGYRIPGVVNTDAHYNFHGSGWLRNYIKSSTDDPAQIDTIEMVHASEKGHIVMTTGPFMEVSLAAGEGGKRAIPGEDLAAPKGNAALHVRVQCPNWFDINRVQVFLNGRMVPELNFTRRTHSGMFGTGVVKFDQSIPLQLKEDAHVIVAAAGDGLQLGPVMGTDRGKLMPVAVSNPIFVDVDGGGFRPNGDLLDLPIPTKE